MTRQARILTLLEAARSVPAPELAGALDISRRTLAAEVASLQDLLGTSASVSLDDGRYRLLVADPPRYRAVRASVEGEASFNDPATRASYIIANLIRALVPVRIDELASAMAVGRTTVVTDLVRVRELLSQDDLSVDGRPNVGLSIHGPELQRRLHLLRHHYPTAYPPSPLQDRVEAIVRDLAGEAGLEKVYVPELTRWATVCVDRTRTARPIDALPSGYSGLVGTPANGLANALADALAAEFDVTLNADERIFLTLPIAGMRAPGDPAVATRFSGVLGEDDALVREVLAAVRDEMNINLASAGYLTEFARHLAYMLNRMRYRIWIDDSGVAGVRQEFPVACTMATVAARVIERRVGIPVSEPELAFLATYFQVFLEGRERGTDHLRVAVVASTGRVTAELVRLQLGKVLPSGTELRVVALAEATRAALADTDLVVVAGSDEIDCAAPTLHVTRVLDRAALARQLERLQLRIPLGTGVGPSSVLAGALDERRFFALPAGTDYADAVDYMTGHLEARGLVDEGFGERIRRREAQAQMQLDPWVGFPHAPLPADAEVMLAIGVVPREEGDDGVRLIVLLGVPEGSSHSQDVLVQVYDEVLRLGARRDLLSEACTLTSFEQFYYFLEKNPTTER